MADKPPVPKHGDTRAAQLLQQLDRPKTQNAEPDARDNVPFPATLTEGETTGDNGKNKSAISQSITVNRGPSAICFITGNKRRKAFSYAILPEWEMNESGTVLVLQFASANVEVRGRNLLALERDVALGRAEFVRITDGATFSPLEAQITAIVFHPPQPGPCEWSAGGEYQPFAEGAANDA